MAKKKSSSAGSDEATPIASKPSEAKSGEAKPGVRSLRSQISAIDRAILDSVAERFELVRQLSELKPEENSAQTTVKSKSLGQVPRESVDAILREVVASSSRAVGKKRIAYLGPEDSFSHLTAISQFGEASDLVPVATIGAVFDEVSAGSCELGVVPLENSTHGRVTDTLEAFARSEVRICREAPMQIHHCLLGKGKRADIKHVYSKPQALSQCAHWLAEHLPGAELHAWASTSDAARLASEKPGVAAIASEQAGKRHGLSVLAENIEDQKDNVTRFAVIGLESAPKTGDDKTALMLEIAHEPGSLADVMAIFKRQKLNMTWIESFPIPGSGGRYLFFIEFLGHAAELRTRRAIASLEKKCTHLTVLGSYARGTVLG